MHGKIFLEYLHRFWNLWSRSYLLSLRKRHQSVRKDPRLRHHFILNEGEVVLSQEDDLPREQWKMAKIIAVKYSSDVAFSEFSVITLPAITFPMCIPSLFLPLCFLAMRAPRPSCALRACAIASIMANFSSYPPLS
jgi:hypothetical protein